MTDTKIVGREKDVPESLMRWGFVHPDDIGVEKKVEAPTAVSTPTVELTREQVVKAASEKGYGDEEKNEVRSRAMQASDDFVGELQWQVRFNIEEFTTLDKSVAQLKGSVRGIMGEKVSGAIDDLDKGIVWGGQHLENEGKYRVVPRKDTKAYLISGQVSQEVRDVLKKIPGDTLENIFEERVIEEFHELSRVSEGKKSDDELWKTARETVKSLSDKQLLAWVKTKEKQELVEGYGAPEGVYYKETVNPDGFLIDESGKYVWPVEVKAYPDEEWRIYLNKLKENFPTGGSLEVDVGGEKKIGFNPEAQWRFMDVIKGEALDVPVETGKVLLLRVAADADNDTLGAMAGLIEDKYRDKSGNRIKLVIQKLPFTAKEMDAMGETMLIANMDKFRAPDKYGNVVDERAIEAVMEIVGAGGKTEINEQKLEIIRQTVENPGTVGGELRGALGKVMRGELPDEINKIRLKEFRNFLKVNVFGQWDKEDPRRQGEITDGDLDYLREQYKLFDSENKWLGKPVQKEAAIEMKKSAEETEERALGEKERIDLLLQAVEVWKRGDKAELERLLKPILG